MILIVRTRCPMDSVTSTSSPINLFEGVVAYEALGPITTNPSGTITTTLVPLTPTENGDKAYATSGSACLDFFIRITRSAKLPDYVNSFMTALNEDYGTAMKILFNLRDIRKGKGEKLIPIVLMVCMKSMLSTETYAQILKSFVAYGCWKDVLRIIEIQLRLDPAASIDPELNLFADQLHTDYGAYMQSLCEIPLIERNRGALATTVPTEKKVAITLCAKWAPSEKTHYNQAPMLVANRLAKILKQDMREYRRMLSRLRAHLCVLERFMSTNQTDQIDFSKIPSVAMSKMKVSFNRDTNANGLTSDSRAKLHKSYEEFLKKLSEGKTKVNVKGIQPHELVNTYLMKNTELDLLVEAQWSTLVANTKQSGTFKNTVAIVDTSGSMQGEPMEVAVAMGILVAECTESADNRILTFSESPRWHELTGTTLREKVNSIVYKDWGMSTNLRAVFDLILTDAIDRELSRTDIVDTLIIFTDMQFDSVTSGSPWESTFETATNKFRAAGYELPSIVCWNLRTSGSKSLPVTKDTKGYVMLSGFSAEMLRHLINGEEMTPYTMMMHALAAYETIARPESCRGLPFELSSLQTSVEQSAFKKAFKKPQK